MLGCASAALATTPALTGRAPLRYLFGGNADQADLKMTTPVISAENSRGQRTMSFVMGSQYWGQTGIRAAPAAGDAKGAVVERPHLLSQAGTEVVELKKKNILAVQWFGGLAGKAEVAKQTAALERAIAQSDEYEIAAGASAATFTYNDPFQPPWKRRNEVAFPVARKEKA